MVLAYKNYGELIRAADPAKAICVYKQVAIISSRDECHVITGRIALQASGGLFDRCCCRITYRDEVWTRISENRELERDLVCAGHEIGDLVRSRLMDVIKADRGRLGAASEIERIGAKIAKHYILVISAIGLDNVITLSAVDSVVAGVTYNSIVAKIAVDDVVPAISF